MLKDLLGEMGINRLMRTYEQMNRKEMARAIADASDELTQVECRDKLVEVEDKMMDEVNGDIPKEAEPIVRVIIQNNVVNCLAEGDANDGQEC